MEKKEGGDGSRSILSSGFITTARLLRAHVFTPLVEAAASRPEEGERYHRGGIFHPTGGMSRAPPRQDEFDRSRLVLEADRQAHAIAFDATFEFARAREAIGGDLGVGRAGHHPGSIDLDLDQAGGVEQRVLRGPASGRSDHAHVEPA
jgi:hypothetical protein